MRPLFFDETNNSYLYQYSKAYLWGQDFLVSPILESSVNQQDVYFPKNNVWFDFYTDERIEGGQTKSISIKENSIPTFVRGGAFIPMAKPMQSTKEYDGNTIELHYYFDENIKESEGQLYNDDGLSTNAFELGKYELLHFESELEKQILEIELEAEIGEEYSVGNKQVELIIHNINNMPKRVKINSKKVRVNFDFLNKTISIPLVWNTKNETEIKIKLNK
jgi:oligosaccharide 4-alpha-D-glucosyltransferase